MKYVAIPVGELRSNRFETFLELMGADEEAQARMVVWGHLMTWYCRWSSDNQFDHGVFWGITEKRMGLWSEYPDALKFGRNLVRAGYVAPIKELYEDRSEDGFVVLNGDGGVALDVSWDGWHRKSPINGKLAHYLSDARRRDYWVANLNGSTATVTSDGGSMESSESSGSRDMDPSGQPTYGAGGGNGRNHGPFDSAGNFPETFRKDSGRMPEAFRPPSSKTSKDVKDVKEGMNIPTSNVNDVPADRGDGGETRGPPGDSGRNGSHLRTGKTKTIAQRDFIRDHKYDDTMGCLCILDDSTKAKSMWLEVCERDIGFAHTVLAELVETDEAWAKLANPCAVVVKRVLPHIQRLRRTRTKVRR